MFSCKNVEIVFRSKFLGCWTKGHFRTKFNRDFFFLAKDFSIWFLDLLNMWYTSFHAKMPTLYSGQNFWQVGPIGIFELNLTKFLFIYYFFLQEIFPFVSCSTIYAIYKFSGKNANIIFQKKLLASRAWGHFWTKFNHVFFFFLGKDFLFVLGPLNMLSSICTKMLALYSYQNSCPARPEGFLEKNLTKFFFLQNIFEFVSWISKYDVYKFSYKNADIVFRQNSWLAGAGGIFIPNLTDFFFLRKIFVFHGQ